MQRRKNVKTPRSGHCALLATGQPSEIQYNFRQAVTPLAPTPARGVIDLASCGLVTIISRAGKFSGRPYRTNISAFHDNKTLPVGEFSVIHTLIEKTSK